MAPGSLHTALLGGTRDSPEHPLFLVVHGTMDRASTFRRMAAHLSPFRVIGYDRRGYSGSIGRGLTRTFDDQISDLIEVIEGRRVVAFGHSYGGLVLLATAVARPDLFAGAVVWETPRSWVEYWPVDSGSKKAVDSGDDPEAAAEGFMRHVVGDQIWEHLPRSTREQRRAEGAAMLADFNAVGHSPPFVLEDLSVPLIVGYGGRSKAHHARNAREMAASVAEGRVAVIADAGHNAHLSHPAQVAELLKEMAFEVEPESNLGEPRGL